MIHVETRNRNGSKLHGLKLSRPCDAVEYMVEQSAAAFVDGFTVSGFGIVRVVTAGERFSWLDEFAGEFVEGDRDELLETFEKHAKYRVGGRWMWNGSD